MPKQPAVSNCMLCWGSPGYFKLSYVFDPHGIVGFDYWSRC